MNTVFNTPKPRRVFTATLALLLIVLAGVVVLLSAPRPHASSVTRSLSFNSHQLVGDMNSAPANVPIVVVTSTPTTSTTTNNQVAIIPTDTPAVPGAPTATDTPVSPTATNTPIAPTPTDTPIAPNPTATSTPIPPMPTSTPSPTWNTIGSYSGNAPATLTTLYNVTGPVRITWTCQYPDGVTSWMLVFTMTDAANSNIQTAQGASCQNGNTSGVFTFDPESLSGGSGADFILTVGTSSGSSIVGPWTATVEQWY